MSTEIVTYDPRFKQAFHDITMRWLARDFTVEPQHTAMLTNPEGELLAQGGEVYFALENGEPVGTVALKNHGEGVYELTKLGVDDRAQSGGHGRRLCEAVIEGFKSRGGTRLFLESNTILERATALYEKLGFTFGSNPDGGVYECTNCYMEWQSDAAEPALTIERAVSAEDQEAVKTIFQEFVDFLPIDLDFQGIDDEMASFPAHYEFMLLAKLKGKPVGAVALKRHDENVCEMKRLYVRPDAQGTGAGRKLCERLMSDAKGAGYQTMLLDSLRRLEAAVALYQKLGFEEIEPYNFNPEDDVIYMNRAL